MKQKINKIYASLLAAELGTSKLTPEILNYRGQTSRKIKHYLNNLLELPERLLLLEIMEAIGGTDFIQQY